MVILRIFGDGGIVTIKSRTLGPKSMMTTTNFSSTRTSKVGKVERNTEAYRVGAKKA